MTAIVRTASGGFIVADWVQAARVIPCGPGWVIQVLVGGKWVTTTHPVRKELPLREVRNLEKWLMTGPPDGEIFPPPRKKVEQKAGTA